MTLLREYNAKQCLQGRNITMDNYYTSFAIAEELLSKFRCTMTGTLKSNRRSLPKEILKNSDKEDFYSNIFWESEKQKITLTQYVVPTKSKGRKTIAVLSTFPPYLGVTQDERKKPQIIKVYDFTNGGTDICDQRSGNYTKKYSFCQLDKKSAKFYDGYCSNQCPDHFFPQ